MKYSSSEKNQNVPKPQSGRDPNRLGMAGLIAATTCLIAATAVALFGCKSSSSSGGGASMPGTLPLVYSVEKQRHEIPGAAPADAG